jgi:hypothetical protein
MPAHGSVVVMDEEARRAAQAQRKKKHEAKVARLKEILTAAGYNCGRGLFGSEMEIEFFLGRGSVAVIALCNHKDICGVDILIPFQYASETDETLEALRKALAS